MGHQGKTKKNLAFDDESKQDFLSCLDVQVVSALAAHCLEQGSRGPEFKSRPVQRWSSKK